MIQILIAIANHLNTNTGKLPVVYIAGKVTGLPYNEVWQKFKVKQIELQHDGFFVLNPCDFITEQEDWQQAMRIAVILLSVSNSIYLLHDWHLSTGATLERNLSQPLGITTMES